MLPFGNTWRINILETSYQLIDLSFHYSKQVRSRNSIGSNTDTNNVVGVRLPFFCYSGLEVLGSELPADRLVFPLQRAAEFTNVMTVESMVMLRRVLTSDG